MKVAFAIILFFLFTRCNEESKTSNDKIRNNIQNKSNLSLDLSNKFLEKLPDTVYNKKYTSINIGLNNNLSDVSKLLQDQSELIFFAADFNRLKKFPLNDTHKSIITISLKGNLIQDIPATICNFNSLKYINLKENQITSIPQCFWDLTNLEEANFSFNKIESIKISKSCGGIIKLDLQSNSLNKIPKDLINLPRLEYLNLADNLLTSIPFDSLPSNVIKITLGGNPIPAYEKERIIKVLDPERKVFYW